MATFAINLGLKIADTDFVIPSELAGSVLASHCILPAYPTIIPPRVTQSDTEPTLVGWFTDGSDVPRHITHRALHRVAVALQQDAIAVVWQGDIGELIGPRASAWGQFDPTKFIAAMSDTPTLAAYYTNGTKHRPAKLDIVEIVAGRNENRRTPIIVSGKREARQVALAAGATPWNF